MIFYFVIFIPVSNSKIYSFLYLKVEIILVSFLVSQPFYIFIYRLSVFATSGLESCDTPVLDFRSLTLRFSDIFPVSQAYEGSDLQIS